MAGRVICSETDTGLPGDDDVRFTRFCDRLEVEEEVAAGLPDDVFLAVGGLDMLSQEFIMLIQKNNLRKICRAQFKMSEEALPDRVKLKKWNAVALWAYETTGGTLVFILMLLQQNRDEFIFNLFVFGFWFPENCPICLNALTERCK